jgi:6 kDa early secretory antigenic target
MAYQIDAATLHAAAKDVRSSHDAVNIKLGNLRGEIDDLVAAWKGNASAGFVQVMRRWDQDVSGLLRSMNNIADLLDKSANTHTANEEEQANMFNKYGSTLNP